MHNPGVFARDDTMFGVCEALGEDFGFNPNLLRVLVGVGLLLNPFVAAGAYAAFGALVAVSRWLVPDLRPALPDLDDSETAEQRLSGQDQADEYLALAA